MAGFSNEFRSGDVELKDASRGFAYREKACERRWKGIWGGALRDGVAQAKPQEIAAIRFVEQGRGERQTAAEFGYAWRKRGVLFGMSENYSGWFEQFEKDICGYGVARLVLYGQINDGAIGDELDASGVFLHAHAGLRMGRGQAEKTHKYGFEDTAGLVTHRPHPRLRMRYKQRLIIGCV
jgi:hypothetical protein